jgi:hypothetical protein
MELITAIYKTLAGSEEGGLLPSSYGDVERLNSQADANDPTTTVILEGEENVDYEDDDDESEEEEIEAVRVRMDRLRLEQLERIKAMLSGCGQLHHEDLQTITTYAMTECEHMKITDPTLENLMQIGVVAQPRDSTRMQVINYTFDVRISSQNFYQTDKDMKRPISINICEALRGNNNSVTVSDSGPVIDPEELVWIVYGDVKLVAINRPEALEIRIDTPGCAWSVWKQHHLSERYCYLKSCDSHGSLFYHPGKQQIMHSNSKPGGGLYRNSAWATYVPDKSAKTFWDSIIDYGISEEPPSSSTNSKSTSFHTEHYLMWPKNIESVVIIETLLNSQLEPELKRKVEHAKFNSDRHYYKIPKADFEEMMQYVKENEPKQYFKDLCLHIRPFNALQQQQNNGNHIMVELDVHILIELRLCLRRVVK